VFFGEIALLEKILKIGFFLDKTKFCAKIAKIEATASIGRMCKASV
jgi:hypothetical protein